MTIVCMRLEDARRRRAAKGNCAPRRRLILGSPSQMISTPMHPDAPRSVKPARKLAVAGIVVGSLLTLSPLFGVIGTIIGMIGAFNKLAESGIADPQALSGHIHTTLVSTATGLFLFPVGLVVLTVSIIFYLRRKASLPPPLP
jgi:flagellar motor component MotA